MLDQPISRPQRHAAQGHCQAQNGRSTVPLCIFLSNTPPIIQGKAISLEGVFSDDGEDDSSPKWVQVAAAGEFKGYADGKTFKFDKKVFQQVIDNLHNHPSFRAGEDGVGVERVIPWDFHHASEQDATQGEIPVIGAPSQGWTYDMQMRVGENGIELWALTEFLEPAKTYVKDGKYQWASISLWFNAVDPVSGEKVGALITSIALTNTPFIEGMQKLVAQRPTSNPKRIISQSPVSAETILGRWYGPAETPEEAVGSMKELFGLSTASVISELLTEIQKISTWVETDTIPIGVDVNDIIGSMRRILNLPALTPNSEVLKQASQSVASLLNEPALSGVANPAQNPLAANRGGADGGNNMNLEQIAKLLGVRAIEAEVLEAITDSVELRNKVAKMLASKSSSREIVEATEANLQAAEQLSALTEALGVQSPNDAISKVVDLMKSAETLAELQPDYEALKEKQKAAEEAQIALDVNEAIAAHKLPEKTKPALLLQRRHDPKQFQEAYPKLTQEQKTLTKPVAVTPDGAPLKVAGSDGGASSGTTEKIDVSGYPGGSITAKTQEYVKANKLCDTADFDAVHKMAVALKKQGRVFDSSTE